MGEGRTSSGLNSGSSAKRSSKYVSDRSLHTKHSPDGSGSSIRRQPLNALAFLEAGFCHGFGLCGSRFAPLNKDHGEHAAHSHSVNRVSTKLEVWLN